MIKQRRKEKNFKSKLCFEQYSVGSSFIQKEILLVEVIRLKVRNLGLFKAVSLNY